MVNIRASTRTSQRSRPGNASKERESYRFKLQHCLQMILNSFAFAHMISLIRLNACIFASDRKERINRAQIWSTSFGEIASMIVIATKLIVDSAEIFGVQIHRRTPFKCFQHNYCGYWRNFISKKIKPKLFAPNIQHATAVLIRSTQPEDGKSTEWIFQRYTPTTGDDL